MFINRAYFSARVFLQHARLNTHHFYSFHNLIKNCAILQNRSRLCLQKTINYSTTNSVEENVVDLNTFEKVCEETLESLSEYFEQLVENSNNLISADVTYSSGVLTVNLGSTYGTYVINRQSPNKQIWLSSPTSGPKRYDFNPQSNNWIYKHTGESLHGLLQLEISKIVKEPVDFTKCSYASLKNSN